MSSFVFNDDLVFCNIDKKLFDVFSKNKHDISIYNGYSNTYIDIKENGDIKIIIDDSTGIFMDKSESLISISADKIKLKGEAEIGDTKKMVSVVKTNKQTINKYYKGTGIKYDRNGDTNTVILKGDTIILDAQNVIIKSNKHPGGDIL